MQKKSQFASNSLTEHLFRGAIGLALLWYAIEIAAPYPFASLGLGIVTLVVFRGCPICWTIGLFETIYLTYARIKNRVSYLRSSKSSPR
ncbi:hypothetical protein [Pseudoalteromonas sp. OOF1S-7]|uniref:hypothetical protein n=1 Tax=Pseudoalteromonas sp. OOF1S-7 TaxID=2917757 RepID=UPI001EF5B35D|nr:hypothetical protein [Pseudoalteromonas sp. OOF1S-7]MCG7534523.1 hypothetical protein [Pseudoalteromonas sp. OOF1S-7]